MSEKTLEIFRTVLMIVGILLLFIFGSRAAAQARNMKLAGANHKSVFAVGSDIMNILGFGKTEAVGRWYEPQPMADKLPAQLSTVAPIADTSAASSAATSQSSGPSVPASSQGAANSSAGAKGANGQKANGAVNKLNGQTQQVVRGLTDALTKNTSNDFTNLWP